MGGLITGGTKITWQVSLGSRSLAVTYSNKNVREANWLSIHLSRKFHRSALG